MFTSNSNVNSSLNEKLLKSEINEDLDNDGEIGLNLKDLIKV